MQINILGKGSVVTQELDLNGWKRSISLSINHQDLVEEGEAQNPFLVVQVSFSVTDVVGLKQGSLSTGWETHWTVSQREACDSPLAPGSNALATSFLVLRSSG